MTKDINQPGARMCAIQIVSEVLDKRRGLEIVLPGHAGLARLEDRDRNFARLLVLTALRRLGQIDDLLARCMQKPLQARWGMVRHVLRIGVVQLLWLETPPHAAVHESVELAGMLGNESHKGLVNAVLKRVAREGREMLAAQDEARLNTPGWLWESWVDAYGEMTAGEIGRAHAIEPPLDITVKSDGEKWAAELSGELLPTGSIRVVEPGRIEALPGYDDGQWWVQDAAAAIPAKLLGDMRGKRVADLCAAPGGKTAQLLAAGASVVAVDRSDKRLAMLQRNMARLGYEIETITADASLWNPAETFDGVLLDAPCTATGTLRRHPDIAYLKSMKDVVQLRDAQWRLLEHAATLLKPGGVLIYCVCSLQAEEGEKQVSLALEHLPLALKPIEAAEVHGCGELLTSRGELRTLPSYWHERGGMDGFFAARFIRT